MVVKILATTTWWDKVVAWFKGLFAPVPAEAPGTIEAARERPSIKTVEELMAGIGASLEIMDPKARRDLAYTILTGALVGGSAVSLVDIGADFFDFGVGQLFADALRPFVRRLVSMPAEDWLEAAFPYGEMSDRMAVRAIEQGGLTEADLEDTLVDRGIKVKERAKILRYARKTRELRELRTTQVIEEAQDAITYYNADRQLDVALTEVKDLAAEIEKLELEAEKAVTTDPAKELEDAADDLESLMTATQVGTEAARRTATQKLALALAKYGIQFKPFLVKRASTIGLELLTPPPEIVPKRASTIGMRILTPPPTPPEVVIKHKSTIGMVVIS